jgi:hypothetical protein
VKLQAVIRGHLVRKQASESLQCLLAIIKIQGLIRAHQAQHSPGKIQVNDGFLFKALLSFMKHLALATLELDYECTLCGQCL